jgi:hypothetical protein
VTLNKIYQDIPRHCMIYGDNTVRFVADVFKTYGDVSRHLVTF